MMGIWRRILGMPEKIDHSAFTPGPMERHFDAMVDSFESDPDAFRANPPRMFGPMLGPPISNIDANAIVISKDGFYHPIHMVVVDAMSVDQIARATQNGDDIVLCGRRYTPAEKV